MDSMKKILEALLKTARRNAVKVLKEGDDEFLKSNMPLEGHLFLLLTRTGIYKKNHKTMNEEGQSIMTRGAREIASTVAAEIYENYKIHNDYEVRILTALQKCALYDFELCEALGVRLLHSSSVDTTLKCLESRGKIYRDEKFKYNLVEEEAGGAFD